MPTGVNDEVSTQESIVPGLDLANHAVDHSCRWTVWGGQRVSMLCPCPTMSVTYGQGGSFRKADMIVKLADADIPIFGARAAVYKHGTSSADPCVCLQGTGLPDRISLVTSPGTGLRMDEELCITYGDKSNEELLFLYGEVWQPSVPRRAALCKP